jgi:hypothetical protein
LIDPRSRDLLNVQMTEENGGARRSRTDDILLAKQALYQLSYGPSPFGEQPGPFGNLSLVDASVKVVGPIRFELMTSRLSSVRSNQLSYGPIGRTDQTRSLRVNSKDQARSRARDRLKQPRRLMRSGKRNEDGGDPLTVYNRSSNRIVVRREPGETSLERR